MNVIAIYCNDILSITSILCIQFYVAVERKREREGELHFAERQVDTISINVKFENSSKRGLEEKIQSTLYFWRISWRTGFELCP